VSLVVFWRADVLVRRGALETAFEDDRAPINPSVVFWRADVLVRRGALETAVEDDRPPINPSE